MSIREFTARQCPRNRALHKKLVELCFFEPSVRLLLLDRNRRPEARLVCSVLAIGVPKLLSIFSNIQPMPEMLAMFALINPLLYVVLAVVMLPAVFQFFLGAFDFGFGTTPA